MGDGWTRVPNNYNIRPGQPSNRAGDTKGQKRGQTNKTRTNNSQKTKKPKINKNKKNNQEEK